MYIYIDQTMRKTKEDALLTRRQIIENAVELFIRKGFSATTLDEIADEAGVTRGAIYWHFSDKLDIVNELIETEHQQLARILSELFAEEQPPLNKIEKIVGEIVNHFFDNKSFQRFIELTWFKIEYSQLSKLTTSKAELTDYFFEQFETLIAGAQEQGFIKREVSAPDIAVTITNMINGMYRSFYILPGHFGTKDRAMRSFVSYLNLLKV